jgi:hypothetical protein
MGVTESWGVAPRYGEERPSGKQFTGMKKEPLKQLKDA